MNDMRYRTARIICFFTHGRTHWMLMPWSKDGRHQHRCKLCGEYWDYQ